MSVYIYIYKYLINYKSREWWRKRDCYEERDGSWDVERRDKKIIIIVVIINVMMMLFILFVRVCLLACVFFAAWCVRLRACLHAPVWARAANPKCVFRAHLLKQTQIQTHFSAQNFHLFHSERWLSAHLLLLWLLHGLNSDLLQATCSNNREPCFTLLVYPPSWRAH